MSFIPKLTTEHLKKGPLDSMVAGLNFGPLEQEVLAKAKENERLMGIKGVKLANAENARLPIAIEFACKHLHITVPRASLLKESGLSSKVYIEALQRCTNLMGFKFANLNTIDVFAVRYSSTGTAIDARRILEAFKKQDQMSNSLMYQKRNDDDYDTALYHGAAFSVAAKINKLTSVPRRDVFLNSLDVANKKLFLKVHALMERISTEQDEAETAEKSSKGDSIHQYLPQACLPDSNADNQTNAPPSFPQMNSDISQHSSSLPERKDFIPLNTQQSKRYHLSNAQFSSSRSMKMKENAEAEAAKKKKNIRLYSAWKRSVLQKDHSFFGKEKVLAGNHRAASSQ